MRGIERGEIKGNREQIETERKGKIIRKRQQKERESKWEIIRGIDKKETETTAETHRKQRVECDRKKWNIIGDRV